MELIQTKYEDVRPMMQTGDIIGFSSNGIFGKGIRWFTKSPINHVAIVLHNDGDNLMLIIEALDRIRINRLSARIKEKGTLNVWYLPLAKELRDVIDTKGVVDYLLNRDLQSYDWSAIGAFVRRAIFKQIAWEEKEKEDKSFCSELATLSLRDGGKLHGKFDDRFPHNATTISPENLTQMNLFADTYYQIGGKDFTPLPGYNGSQK